MTNHPEPSSARCAGLRTAAVSAIVAGLLAFIGIFLLEPGDEFVDTGRADPGARATGPLADNPTGAILDERLDKIPIPHEPGRGISPREAGDVGNADLPFRFHVSSALGEPIDGAQVTVFCADLRPVLGTTDSGGNSIIAVPRLFKGSALVLRIGFRARLVAMACRGEKERFAPIVMEAAEGNESLLEIRDGTDGAPVADVLVSFDDGRIRANFRTGDSGLVPLPSGLLRFPLRLETRKEGYNPGLFILRSVPAPPEAVFRVFADTGIVFAFRTWDGKPAEVVMARFRTSAEGWTDRTFETRSGPDGLVRFRGFKLGSETRGFLTAVSELAPPLAWSEDLRPHLEGSKKIQVVLGRGLSVRGMLEGRLPASAVRVEFAFPSDVELPFGPEALPLPVRTVEIDPGGGFSLDGAREGPVRARVRSEDCVFALVGLAVQRGKELRIELPDPVEIRVVVRDEDGNPLPGASVVLSRADEGFPELRFRARTDESGMIIHTGIFPGRYACSAIAGGFGEETFDLRLPSANTVLKEVPLRRLE